MYLVNSLRMSLCISYTSTSYMQVIILVDFSKVLKRKIFKLAETIVIFVKRETVTFVTRLVDVCRPGVFIVYLCFTSTMVYFAYKNNFYCNYCIFALMLIERIYLKVKTHCQLSLY